MLNALQILELVKAGEGYNVDFKRSVPSKVREIVYEVAGFANASGGYLLIGVDNDNKIVGAEIDNDKRSAIQDAIGEISPTLKCKIYAVDIDGKTVWVIDVPGGKDKPYITGGVIYIREGANCQKLRTAEEMRAFFAECSKIFYDAVPCSGFDMFRDIDSHNFKSFLEKAHISDTLPITQLFDNLELLTDEGVVKNAGALFFGREPEHKFPHAAIRCVRFKGIDKVHIIDDKTFGGPLYRQYVDTLSWIESKLDVEYIIEGTDARKEIWEIPLDVFKEAVMNAICHRDFYEKGATAMVEIYDDRVEISNPGGLLPMVAEKFGHKSMSRNPLIFGLFSRMHLVEKIGSGIPRMCQLMKDAGLPAPIFDTKGFFTVTFMKPVKEKQVGTINGTIKEREKQIVSLLELHEGLSAVAIAAQLNVGLRTLMRSIKTLSDNGVIEYRGAKKTGGYFIK